ncbi:MAG: SDR family oxidoreductase [Spirochaetota bacterium]
MAKAVIITGGGSGIGKSLGRYFAARGWNVCIADIVEERVKETASEITPEGIAVLAIRVDTRVLSEVKAMMSICLKNFRRIDALVNNAGITDKKHREILDLPYEMWNEVLSVNLTGSFICLKEYCSIMKKQGGGNVVNITSPLGHSGHARSGDTVYGVSKAALESLTEYASVEMKEFGININSAYPDVMVNTDFFSYLAEDARKELASPSILNELVYVLCNLKPGELTGRFYCAEDWKQDPVLEKVYRLYFGGSEGEGTI